MAKKFASLYNISLESEEVVAEPEVVEETTVDAAPAENIEETAAAMGSGEEAVEVIDEQIQENEEKLEQPASEVTEEDVVASQEALFIALGRFGMGKKGAKKFRVSSESFSSPYKALKVSNEQLKAARRDIKRAMRIAKTSIVKALDQRVK